MEPTEIELRSLEKAVFNLFETGFLTDIECRKIVCTNDLGERRVAIYPLIVEKDQYLSKNILRVFKSTINPLVNPKILKTVFSFLPEQDITNCRLVCRKWSNVARLVCFVYQHPKLIFKSVGISKNQEAEGDEHAERVKVIIVRIKGLSENIGRLKKGNIAGQCTWKINRLEETVVELMLTLETEDEENMLEIIKNHNNADFNKKIQIDNDYGIQDDNVAQNALKSDAILSNLFKVLPLEDLKNCRSVNRHWCSVAETYFRRKSQLGFTKSFRPRNYLETLKYSLLPDLPFKNIKLSAYLYSTTELLDFFSKGGQNVNGLIISSFQFPNEISSCLSYTQNLTELYLHSGTLLYSGPIIPWKKLHLIKLVLTDVLIKIDRDKKIICPLKVELHDIKFSQEGNIPTLITFNDFLNFSQTKEIVIGCTRDIKQMQNFDWAANNINFQKATFCKVNFINWTRSEAKVDFLKLVNCPFLDRNFMPIKKLVFEDGLINISALPRTLEKLWISGERTRARSNDIINLPNLIFLSNGLNNWNENNENIFTWFQNCNNLVDIDCKTFSTNDAGYIRSARRMKIEMFRVIPQIILPLTIINLDVLILKPNHFPLVLENVTELLLTIKPSTLVMTIIGAHGDEALLYFLFANQNVEKIIIEFELEHSSIFDWRTEAGSWYEFINPMNGVENNMEDFFNRQITNVLTQKQFTNYQNLIDSNIYE